MVYSWENHEFTGFVRPEPRAVFIRVLIMGTRHTQVGSTGIHHPAAGAILRDGSDGCFSPPNGWLVWMGGLQ